MTERNILQIIEQAREHINNDPHLANYILRDLKVVKDAELSDLAWSMHKQGCVREDVEYLISELEKYLEKTFEKGMKENNK